MPKIPGLSFESKAPGAIPGGPGIVSPAKDDTGAAIARLGEKTAELGSGLLDIFQETQARKAVSDAQASLQDTMMYLRYGRKNAETGVDEPPPSPEMHGEVFGKEIDRIKEEAGQNLNGKALRMFDSSFNEYANRAMLQTKIQSNEILQGKISVTAQETLHKQATSFVDATPIEKKVIRDQAFRDIDGLVARGVWTPQEGLARKKVFIDDTAKGSAMKMMEQKGGPEMVIGAIENGEYNELPVDTRESIKHKAYEEQYRRVQMALAEERRKEEAALRAERILAEKTAVQGLQLHANGELTPAWVKANMSKLGFDKGRTMMKMASGQEDVIIDNEKLASIMTRAFQGQDVKDEAWQGAGRYWGSTEMKELIRIIDDHSPYMKAGNVYDEGVKNMQGLLSPTAEQRDPSLRGKLAKAITEYTLWFNDPEQKKLTRDELEKRARDYYGRLIDDSLNFNPSKEIFGSRKPLFFEGDRNKATPEDIDKAAKKTKEAFDKGELNERMYREEVIRLNDWKKAAQRKADREKARAAGEKK